MIPERASPREPMGIAIREDALRIDGPDSCREPVVGSGDRTTLPEEWFWNRGWIRQLP
jgi:hypothetical protein